MKLREKLRAREREIRAKLVQGVTVHCTCGAMITCSIGRFDSVVYLHPTPACDAFRSK